MGIPLHVHSSFSPLGGLCHIDEILDFAKKNGIKTLALTETNGFYGLQFFLQMAKEYGIIPLIGAEVKFLDFRLVIICSNNYGYEKLSTLISLINFKKIDEESFFIHLCEMSGDVVLFSDNKELLSKIFSSFSSERIYFEISPGFFNHQDVLWAKKLEIKILATTRARYIKASDHFSYLLISAIKGNKTLSSIKLDDYNESCRLYSPKEFYNLFTQYPEAVENTYKVAEICHFYMNGENIIFPKFDNLDSIECDQILRKKCFEGINFRYPQGAHYDVIKRLEHELKVISQKGFSSYFLVVEDIVSNSPRTCGRGSAASSLVSFLLGITQVDPVKHNLFFDRFLNPERSDPPDIDVDFPWDERDHLLDYVFLKYPNHSAMVSNHNTLQGRSSLREVAKVFGVPPDEINYIIKRFPRVELNKTWQNIVVHAERIQNLFQTLSVHPGGVVITPKPIASYVPLQLTPKGVPVIQWEKRQTEMGKLVKIDLLGNRSLAVIRDCINSVNKNYGKSYLYQNLSVLDDPRAKKLIEHGETMGVFYIESPASRLLLSRMKSSEFEHIVIASSIIRPAANKFAHDFVRRLHGERYIHLHPLLKPILDETFGIMVYQEQVTQVAMALADFSSTEGNNLRKILDKKEKKKKLEEYKAQFYENAMKKNISTKTLDQVWEMIMSFSGYSFCKAHSASYALVSFKSCYLKANYPAEFMAAVISNQGGFYSTFAYLDEARRMNIKILPPDVNYSLYEYSGNKDTIRTGLMQLKNLSNFCIKKILSEREKGLFISLEDFLERVNPSFEDAKILVKVRAFHSINKNFCAQMWKVYAYRYGRKNFDLNLPVVRPYDSQKLINWELSHLDGAVAFPEWALYKKYLTFKNRVRSVDLKYHIGKDVTLFGLYVTGKKVRTKNDEPMCFVTFSDETGLTETVFFPPSYLVFRDLLALEKAFLFVGRVEETLGSLQVNVSQLKVVRSEITN
jgi:DNA-directed DNA polymerase III PolC